MPFKFCAGIGFSLDDSIGFTPWKTLRLSDRDDEGGMGEDEAESLILPIVIDAFEGALLNDEFGLELELL